MELKKKREYQSAERKSGTSAEAEIREPLMDGLPLHKREREAGDDRQAPNDIVFCCSRRAAG